MAAIVPPTLTVRAELSAKPVAVMVALVPTGPDVGVSPVAEAVTTASGVASPTELSDPLPALLVA